MGTAKGERRRQELVAAAASLLREGGLEAIRHRAVAERAGLPLASTTYYFRSLDDLVSAAVAHTGHQDVEAGRTQLARLPDGPVGTSTLIEFVLDQLLGPESREGGLDAVLMRYERLIGVGRRPFLAPLMQSMRPELDAFLSDVLSRSGRDMDKVARWDLVALVDGSVIAALVEANPDPRSAARAALVRYFGAGAGT